MKEFEQKPTGLLHAGDELRKLLLEHPDLPLLVFAGEDAVCGEWSWTSCSSVRAELGEFLDCQQSAYPEKVFADRQEFEEELEEHLFDGDLSDEEFKRELAAYEPYWKPCIILYVDN